MGDAQATLDLLDRVLSKQLAWIAAADSKAALLFSVDSAMLGALAAMAAGGAQLTPEARVFALASAVCLFFGVVCLGLSAIPRMDGPRGSIVFFGGIRSTSEEAYVASMRAGITKTVIDDFARQAHRNAEIAALKFRYVHRATVAVFLALPVWVAAIASARWGSLIT